MNGSGESEGSVISQWFPKCAPRVPRGPRPVPRGSIGIYFSTAVLKFTYVFNEKNSVFLKTNAEILQLVELFISCDLKISN